MKIKLSPRLNAIAGFITPCKSLIDVGTDHGYIPVYAAQNALAEKITATDIVPGPLESAKRSAHTYEVYDKIKFLLSNGLDGIDRDDVDTVIISGLGGETIISILEKAYWLKTKDVTLIIQPQSKIGELNLWLEAEGYVINDAALVEDEGKLYIIYKVTTGESRQMVSTAEIYVNRILMDKKDPLLPRYLEELIRKAEYALTGMQKAKRAVSSAEIMHMRVTLNGLKKMKEETGRW